METNVCQGTYTLSFSKPEKDRVYCEQGQIIVKRIELIDDSQQTKIVRKLQAVLHQISAVIDDETQALKHHENPDFHDIKARKARGLQALSLLLDEIKPQMLDENSKMGIRTQFDQLRAKLAQNQQLLQIHMEAVGELVEMINSAAHAQETDGTYDPFCVADSASKKQPLYEDQPQ